MILRKEKIKGLLKKALYFDTQTVIYVLYFIRIFILVIKVFFKSFANLRVRYGYCNDGKKRIVIIFSATGDNSRKIPPNIILTVFFIFVLVHNMFDIRRLQKN